MGGMRGGSMMRGGRGGISPSPMMGMPMGGMNMAGMAGPMGPMSMGMPPMNGVGLQGMHDTFASPEISHAFNSWVITARVGMGRLLLLEPGARFITLLHILRQHSQAKAPSPFHYVTATHPSTPVNTYSHMNNLLTLDSSLAGPAGFQGGQSHYNPTFFPQQGPSGVADANWNPHGAKRTRQE